LFNKDQSAKLTIPKSGTCFCLAIQNKLKNTLRLNVEKVNKINQAVNLLRMLRNQLGCNPFLQYTAHQAELVSAPHGTGQLLSVCF
jgi:hypothetical protein